MMMTCWAQLPETDSQAAQPLDSEFWESSKKIWETVSNCCEPRGGHHGGAARPSETINSGPLKRRVEHQDNCCTHNHTFIMPGNLDKSGCSCPASWSAPSAG